MNKKGFSLIELIGTIIIFALMLLIVVPTVSKVVKKSGIVAANQCSDNIILAARNWSLDNRDKLPKKEGDVYCLDLDFLVSGGYLDEGKRECDVDQVEIKGILVNGKVAYEYSTSSDGECSGKINVYDLNFSLKCVIDDGDDNDSNDVELLDDNFIKDNVKLVVNVNSDDNYPFENLTYVWGKGGQHFFETTTNSYVVDVADNEVLDSRYEARVVNDKRGKTKSQSCNVKIDKKHPEINMRRNDDNITIILSDNPGSGLKESQEISYQFVPSNISEIDDVKTPFNELSFSNDSGVPSVEKDIALQDLADGEYCLWIKGTMSDIVGNDLIDYADGSNTNMCFVKDTEAPTIAINPDKSSTLLDDDILVTIEDKLSGLKSGQHIKYAWSKSNTVVPSFSEDSVIDLDVDDGVKKTEIKIPKSSFENLEGSQHLWLELDDDGISDMFENKTDAIKVSGPYLLNVDSPTMNYSGGTVPKSTSQNLVFQCMDSNAVTAYYFGTIEPKSVDDINISTPADLSALMSSNGLSKTVYSNGIYWFACRNAGGGYVKSNIVIRKYQVQNVLEKINGTTGIYNDFNYAVNDEIETYYIKDGTTLSANNIYDVPLGAASSTFKGYTTKQPGSETKLKTTSLMVNDNTTKYYMWFDRNKYNIKISSGEYGQLRVNTIKESENSVTVLAGGEANLTVKYGDTLKATAIPNSGYAFAGWGGSYISGAANPAVGTKQITKNETIIGNFSDGNKPTAEITAPTDLKKSTSIATLTCDDIEGISGYYIGTTEPTPSSVYTSITPIKHFSIEQTIDSANTYYLSCRDTDGYVSNVSKITYYTYTVNYMLQNILPKNNSYTYTSDDYTQKSTHTWLAPENTVLTLASLVQDNVPVGSNSNRYVGVSNGAASTTAVSPSKTDPSLTSNSIYSIWFTRNLVFIRLNPNGGTVTPQTTNAAGTTTYNWSVDSASGNIKRSSNGGEATMDFTYVRYGVSLLDLPNYNNTRYLNITKSSSAPVSGAEWKCKSGCKTANMTLAQSEVTLVTPSDGEQPTDMLCNAKNADCTIVLDTNWKSAVVVPTAANYCQTGLVYNGSSQTIVKSAGSGFTWSSGTTATNAGSQNVIAKLTSGNVWADGTTGDKTISCSIAKATPIITLSESSGIIAKGKTRTFTATVKSGGGTLSGKLNVTSGTTSHATVSPNGDTTLSSINNSSGKATSVTITGVAAGSSTITVKFTPNDTSNYNSASNKTYTATVKNAATIPTAASYCQTGLVYNGLEQTIVKAAGTGYAWTAGTKKTNAGSQNVTATLSTGYAWTDNSTGTKIISCSIAKATPTITLSSNSGLVGIDMRTTFTATVKSGGGTLSGKLNVTSGTPANVVVSPNGDTVISSINNSSGKATTITMRGVKAGNSTITVKFTPNDTTNYNSASNKTYTAIAVSRTDLYVSSSGDNSTGYGTIAKPYRTVTKAYNEAANTATIYVMDTVTVDSGTVMDDGKNITLTSCTKNGSSCPVGSANTLKFSSSGSGIMLALTKGTLNLQTVVVTAYDDLKENTGSLVRIGSDTTLNIKAGTVIRGNYTSTSGAGVYNNEGTVNMSGGTISNNIISSGAGMGAGVYSSGTFTMSGGTIKENSTGCYANSNGQAFDVGGGIYSSGTLTLKGSAVVGSNSSANGGGIYSSGTFKMESSSNKTPEVRNNIACWDGGGIYLLGNQTKTISAGVIYNNNSSTSGGGIRLAGGTLNITGGTIKSNKAKERDKDHTGNGGGIALSGGTVKITNGILESNSASSGEGGGVRVGSGGTFYFGGTTGNRGVIRSNSAKSNGGISVHKNGRYVRNKDADGTRRGYVCKNNSPVNSYDTTPESDSHCT